MCKSTGLLWVICVVERLYRAESIQMPILPRVFCRISFMSFCTLKLFNPVINSNSMRAVPLKLVLESQEHCPACLSGENRDCRIGEYS